MEWNVYTYDFNGKRVETYNVFDHCKIMEDCQKALKKFGDDKEKFLEELRRSLMYYYWSKCEWEVVISDWPPHPDWPDKKIDVYDQVMLNWHVFSEYVWEHRQEFKKRRRRSGATA